MLRLHLKSEHPQPRHVSRAVELLKGGGLAIYPTDTTYALGCDLYSKRSIERIYQLKGLTTSHPLSFLCHDLSQVAQFAIIEDRNYRILRHHLPGEYTFVLPATREVPKVVLNNARTVGIRIPSSPTCQAIVAELGHPLMSTTVSRRTDEQDTYFNDPDDIATAFGRSVEVLLDAGPLYGEPSSVIDLTGDAPVVVRKGAGDLSWLTSDA